MKRASLLSVFLFLTAALTLCQRTPVPLSNSNAGVASPVSRSQADPKAQARILEQYGKLPLSFEANDGQTDSRVKFLSRTSGYSLFLTGDEAVLALSGKAETAHKAIEQPKIKMANAQNRVGSSVTSTKNGGVLRMKLRNANPAAKVTGVDELTGTSNYFIGNDPVKWRTNVPTYAKVKYEGIYSGIDLVYYGNQRQLEYDFVVAPGADPCRIAFNVSGAKRIRRDARGELVFRVGEDEIRWHKPVVYQEKDGARQEIAARYAITDTDRVTFELANYDASRPLYIDPLIYSTYLGGGGNDQGSGIAVDSAGNAYVTGSTGSSNFPTKNPLQSANGGSTTAFVTKINAAGSALVYSTYLGGSGGDSGSGIAVDIGGNAYVTGYTDSTDFPTKNPLQSSNGGSDDAFVAEINAAGSALVYSTYLGGSGSDGGSGIAVDSAGNAYVTGSTSSTDFPTKNPFQPTLHGGNPSYDAFVAKINSSGSGLVYSTYLGGSDTDTGSGIAVDGAGNAYVTGLTYSTDFPTVNPLQPANAGEGDAFVTKFNPTGSALVYSTYLGGPELDYGSGIATDSGGNAYVTGSNYTDLVCDNRTGRCLFYAFVSKINPTGSAFVYGADVGNSNYANGYGIAVDSSGSAYVVGIDNGYRTFVEKLDPSGLAVGSPTYLNGGGGTFGYGIATDGSDNAYVTGTTRSTKFPTKNPIQPANAGGYDAFVSKIDMRIVTTTTLTSSPNPSTHGQAVTFTAMVTSSSGAPPNGETISFVKGKAVLGTETLSGGTATFTTSTLPVGTNSIQALYGGDTNFVGSKSKVVKQVVN